MSRGALVTGAGGFIGSHFVQRLAAQNQSFAAIDLHEPATAGPLPNGVFRCVDIRDRASVAAVLANAEVVFNLASVHLEVGASYDAFQAVNVLALEQLVELCAVAGVRRLVHVSSVGVYGHVESPPAAEDAPFQPQNDYERTKASGERAAMSAAIKNGVDLIILRPSWVYGTGCPRTEKLIDALRRRRFFYIGSGRNLRHPLFIDDFLDAMLLAAEAGPEARGRAFNIAGPTWMTLEEMVRTFAEVIGVEPPGLHVPRTVGLLAGSLAELLASVTGIQPPISRRTLAFFENDNAFSIDAARQYLKWQPRVDLRSGVAKIMAVRHSDGR